MIRIGRESQCVPYAGFKKKMFHNVRFCLEILSTNMTSILIPYDYPCEQEVSDNVHR